MAPSRPLLSIGAGTLMLADAHVAVATLDPAKAFGPSAFGPLRFRVVADGVPGSWLPLATLVRLPRLASLECPSTAEVACRLSGTDLFLHRFGIGRPAVPQRRAGARTASRARPCRCRIPQSGELYVRLRDDPAIVNAATWGRSLAGAPVCRAAGCAPGPLMHSVCMRTAPAANYLCPQEIHSSSTGRRR